MSENPLVSFADEIINGIGGLKTYQDREIAVENYEHDVCVVIWTLKCLANPRNELSGTVLKLVNERFKKLKKQQKEIKE